MKSLFEKKLCYSRADDWDYEEIINWRAATPEDGKCINGDSLCGGGESSKTNYCANKIVFVENGSICPINSF